MGSQDTRREFLNAPFQNSAINSPPPLNQIFNKMITYLFKDYDIPTEFHANGALVNWYSNVLQPLTI